MYIFLKINVNLPRLPGVPVILHLRRWHDTTGPGECSNTNGNKQIKKKAELMFQHIGGGKQYGRTLCLFDQAGGTENKT